jgi:hypothetical protein
MKCNLCEENIKVGVVNYTGRPVCVGCAKSIAKELLIEHI